MPIFADVKIKKKQHFFLYIFDASFLHVITDIDVICREAILLFDTGSHGILFMHSVICVARVTGEL